MGVGVVVGGLLWSRVVGCVRGLVLLLLKTHAFTYEFFL